MKIWKFANDLFLLFVVLYFIQTFRWETFFWKKSEKVMVCGTQNENETGFNPTKLFSP